MRYTNILYACMYVCMLEGLMSGSLCPGGFFPIGSFRLVSLRSPVERVDHGHMRGLCQRFWVDNDP